MKLAEFLLCHPQPLFNLFSFFSQKFTLKNCRLQLDLNSDCQSMLTTTTAAPQSLHNSVSRFGSVTICGSLQNITTPFLRFAFRKLHDTRQKHAGQCPVLGRAEEGLLAVAD